MHIIHWWLIKMVAIQLLVLIRIAWGVRYLYSLNPARPLPRSAKTIRRPPPSRVRRPGPFSEKLTKLKTNHTPL